MHSLGYTAPGHSNRVFSVKFHPDDQNTLISGGWDNTIQIYDQREEGPVATIFGPVLSGDSLDVHGDTMITGSFRGKDALQVWSLGERELVQSLEWEPGSSYSENAFLFTAQLCKDREQILVAAGGKGDELRLFAPGSNDKWETVAKSSHFE